MSADLKLFDFNSLRVNESMLTGEVYGATKRPEALAGEAGASDQVSMAFSGSVVISGRGSGGCCGYPRQVAAARRLMITPGW